MKEKCIWIKVEKNQFGVEHMFFLRHKYNSKITNITINTTIHNYKMIGGKGRPSLTCT